MDFVYMVGLLTVFVQKIPATLFLILITFAFGFALALLITIVRLAKIPILSAFLEVYVSFIRCIPSILLLFLVYYGLPYLMKSIFLLDINSLDKIFYGILSLVLFNGGQISEILRASFVALDKNQWILADSLGYSFIQTIFKVIFPQSISYALPDLKNAVINVMKDSALLFTIGITDLMGLADIYVGNSFGIRQTEIYMAVGIIYILCAAILNLTVKVTERYLPMTRIKR